jgi:predicted nuclease of predicted toxin-antitoxin system
VKLLLDEHYSPVLAQQLRQRGHDVLAVIELPALRQQPDAEVLAWAATAGRAVVTENVDDFLRLHADYLSRGHLHWGLVLTTRRKFPRSSESMGRLIAALDELLRVLETDDALQTDTHWL